MRKNKKRLELVMTVLILAGSFYIGRYTAAVAEEKRQGQVESAVQVEVRQSVAQEPNEAWQGLVAQQETGNGTEVREKGQGAEIAQNTEEAQGQGTEIAQNTEEAQGQGAEVAQDNMEQSQGQDTEAGQNREKNGEVIVIDAGHGGFDSGKVGINDALEKEVNLAIAKRVQELLEEQDIRVVMTREADTGLYDEGEENKKQQDMKRRCALINESGAAAAVSIHQNSYTQESVHGPQVFYYETSENAKALAAVLQDTLNTRLQIDRPRQIKANDSYYLLKKTSVPTVIVECGFLSNRQEAEKLVTKTYQEEVAQAVCEGIVRYLDDGK